MLASRATNALDALESNFKTLISLHKEAVTEGAEGVINTITTGVGSHRDMVGTWSSTNKLSGGGRKRSATDSLCEGTSNKNKKVGAGQKRRASDHQEGSVRGAQRWRGSGDSSPLRKGARSRSGEKTVKGERDRLRGEADTGSGGVRSGSGEDTASEAITLAPKDVTEVKELMQRLMGYFS